MIATKNFVQERSISIPIKKNLISTINNYSPKSEYSLKNTFFDPTKNSPPNDFMVKLQKRMSIYSNINDDNRESE